MPLIPSLLPPPQPPPDPSLTLPTVTGVPCSPIPYDTPTADDMLDESSAVPGAPHHRDSPRRFSLPAEEDILGLEKDGTRFPFTDFPPGLLSSDCAGATSLRTVLDLDLYEDSWTDEIRAQLPVPASL